MKTIALALAAFVAGISGAQAQQRMKPIPLDQMTPDQRRVADAILAGPRHSIEGPFDAWLRSPVLADRLQKVGEYLRFDTSLDHRLNEFGILITAVYWSCPFEWYAHYPLAVKAGLKPEIAAQLAAGKRPDGMAADEAVVFDFSMQLHQDHTVSDATYRAAVAALGEKGVMDLVALNGYYDVVSMTLNVADVLPPKADATPLHAPKRAP